MSSTEFFLKVTMYFLELYLKKGKEGLLPLNFVKRTKKGLTSGNDSVTGLISTLIACKILQYFQLGIAREKYRRKWLEKTINCRNYFIFIYDFKKKGRNKSQITV